MLPRVQPYSLGASGDTHAGLFEDVATRSLRTTRVGQDAGKVATGSYNAFVGDSAGKAVGIGSYQTAVGFSAIASATDASFSTAVGAFALAASARGTEMTMVGYRAGETAAGADQCVGIGPFALQEASAIRSVGIGYGAMRRLLDGSGSTGVGHQVLENNRSGTFLTAIGYQAGRGAFLGSNSVYCGALAGYSNAYGSGNVLVGYQAGFQMTQGDLSTGIGAYALSTASELHSNVAIGAYSGTGLRSATGTVLLGFGAGAGLQQADYTVATGTGALAAASNATWSVAVGTSALGAAPSTSETVAIGGRVGQYAGALDGSVLIGYQAGLSNQATRSIIVGSGAAASGSASGSILLGYGVAPSLDASDSVFIGAATGAGNARYTSRAILIGSGADTNTSCNIEGIAISGNQGTAAYFGVTIGNQITNARPRTIGIGNALNSDADNTIVLGNTITIQSVSYFNDPLVYPLRIAVATDAAGKLGVSQISYGACNEMLIGPDGTIFQTARAGLFTSNVATNIGVYPQNPASPPSFDLRAVANAAGLPAIQTAPVFAAVRAAPSACNTVFLPPPALTSNPYGPVYTIGAPPAAPYTASLIYTHDASYTISLSSNLGQPAIGVFDVLGASDAASTATVPVYVAKAAAPPAPLPPSVPLSNLPSPSALAFAAAESNFLITGGIPAYAPVEPRPLYGAATLAPSTAPTYTVFPECRAAPSDAFGVLPVYQIDGYGIPATAPSLVEATLLFGSNPPTVWPLGTVDAPAPAPPSNLSIWTVPPLDAIPALPSNATVLLYPAPTASNPAFSVILGSNLIPSNVLVQMAVEHIDLYPDERFLPLAIEGSSNATGALSQIQTAYAPYMSNIALLAVSLALPDSNVAILSQDAYATWLAPPFLSPAFGPAYTAMSNAIAATGCNALLGALDAFDAAYTNTTAPQWVASLDALSNAYVPLATGPAAPPLPPATPFPYSLNTAASNTASLLAGLGYPSPILTSNLIGPAISIAADLWHKYYEVPRELATAADVAAGRVAIVAEPGTIAAALVGTPAPAPGPAPSAAYLESTVPAFVLSNWDTTVWAVPPTTAGTAATSADPLAPLALPLFGAIQTPILDYDVSPPTSGTVSLSPGSAIYIPLDPWAPSPIDTASLIVASPSNPSLMARVSYTISNAIPLPQPVLAMRGGASNTPVRYTSAPDVITLYAPPIAVDITSNTCNTLVFSLVYTTSNTYTGSNLVSTVSTTALSQTTYAPLAAYDPAIGYTFTTCNVSATVSTSNLGSNMFFYTYSNLVGPGPILPPYTSCNWDVSAAYYQTPASAGGSLVAIYQQVVIQERYQAYSSNLATYGFVREVVDHYARGDPSNFLYTTDTGPIPIPAPYSNLAIYPAAAPSILYVSSNLTTTHYFRQEDPVLPITRQQVYPPPIAIADGPSSLGVVVAGTGAPPTTAWDPSVWDAGCNLYLALAPPFPTAGSNTFAWVLPAAAPAAVRLLALPSDTAGAASDRLLAPASGSTIYVPAARVASVSNVLAPDLGVLPFAPTHVYLETCSNGAWVLDGSNLAVSATLADVASGRLGYLATQDDYLQDEWTYWYASNLDQTSSLFQRAVSITREPKYSAQAFNVGLALDGTASVSPLTTSWAWQGTDATVALVPPAASTGFTLAPDGSNVSVDPAVYAGGTVSVPYTVSANGSPVATGSLSWTAFRHDDMFPYPASASNVLRMQQVGADPYSNILLGPMWDDLARLRIQGQPLDPDVLRWSVSSPPAHGFLDPSPLGFPYSAATSNTVRYIAYDPSYVPNDAMAGRWMYDGWAGPLVGVGIQNYYARFPPAPVGLLDQTRMDADARTVIPARDIPASAGFMADLGTGWAPASNTFPWYSQDLPAPLPDATLPLYLPSIGWSGTWAIPTVPYSVPAALHTGSPASLVVDQADQISLYGLLGYVECNVSLVRDIWFGVVDPPAEGQILSWASGGAVARFHEADLRAGNIVYQNLGGPSLSDAFRVAVFTTPYDVSCNVLEVDVAIRPLPIVRSNAGDTIFAATSATLIETEYPFAPRIWVERGSNATPAYVHFVSYSNIEIIPAPDFSDDYLVPPNPDVPYAGYHVSTAVASALSAGTFPALAGSFSANATPDAGHVSRLATIPLYEPVFLYPFSATVNTAISSNVLTGPAHAQTEVLQYVFDPSGAGFSNLTDDHAFTVQYGLRITTPFSSNVRAQALAQAASNPAPAGLDALAAPVETFETGFSIWGSNTSTPLFSAIFDPYTVRVATGSNPGQTLAVPASAQVVPEEISIVSLIMQDAANGGAASLYLNGVNLLQGMGIGPILPTQVRTIEWATDLYSPSNLYLGGGGGVVPAQGPGDLPMALLFENARTLVELENIEMFVKTYATTDLGTNPVSDLYNVIVGQQVNVRGINNICIGQNFATSGANSIIVGNNIGFGASTATASINAIYQSIVLGNNNFVNSIIRNVVAIGNGILNDLSLLDPVAVSSFMSQSPIVIGNQIGADVLDFHINVGNAFMKTSIGGEQIYLGVGGECVAIGYRSNMYMAGAEVLSVGGASAFEAPASFAAGILTDRVAASNGSTLDMSQATLSNLAGIAATGGLLGTDQRVLAYGSNIWAGAVVSASNVAYGWVPWVSLPSITKDPAVLGIAVVAPGAGQAGDVQVATAGVVQAPIWTSLGSNVAAGSLLCSSSTPGFLTPDPSAPTAIASYHVGKLVGYVSGAPIPQSGGYVQQALVRLL